MLTSTTGRRPVKHHFENHDLVTERGSQLIDFTDEVHAAVDRADVSNGMALIYSPHTTCAIRTEGLDDDDLHPNGWSHMRAGLLSSSSQAIPIVDGSLMLGRWQRVFFCELDRSRPRKIFIQVIGE
jgi:thiamine phosphate synthase YjbQ (UPF0047 family)